MMRRIAAVVCTFGIVAPVFAATTADDAAAPKPLAFLSQARVEVDADGKLVQVAVGKNLPDSVRSFIARQLATWTFVPRPRNGTSGIASTWVALSACAVPDANGAYSMGLAFHGNGPRVKGGEPWVIPPEMGKVVSKYKMTGAMDVHFVVNADGTATLESIEGLDDSRGGSLLRTEVQRMVELNHFEPEEIDGQPIATRETLPLEFGPGDGHRTYRFQWHGTYRQSRQCQVAGDLVDVGLPVEVVDSVIEIEPVF